MPEIPNDPPACNHQPGECDCGDREDQVRMDWIKVAEFLRIVSEPDRLAAILGEEYWRRLIPGDRTHAILADSLKRILATIDRSSLRGKRDYALLLLGFVAGLQANEMTQLTAGQLRNRPKGTAVLVSIGVPGSKRCGSTFVLRRGSSRATDPLLALDDWLAASDIRNEDPLFQHVSRVDDTTSGRALSRIDVGNIIRIRAADAGMGDLHLTAHSLRVGHIFTMLAEGDTDL